MSKLIPPNWFTKVFQPEVRLYLGTTVTVAYKEDDHRVEIIHPVDTSSDLLAKLTARVQQLDDTCAVSLIPKDLIGYVELGGENLAQFKDGPVLYKTQKELDEALSKWQKILRLQDWKITARFVKFNEIEEFWGASITIRGCHKSALISLREIGHWHDEVIEHNHEHDLVHELLHLHTQSLKVAESETEHHDGEESCINMLADTILRLAHGEVG